MNCPVCRAVFEKEEKLEIMETRPSILQMGIIVTLGCEACGFVGTVKLNSEGVQKLGSGVTVRSREITTLDALEEILDQIYSLEEGIDRLLSSERRKGE